MKVRKLGTLPEFKLEFTKNHGEREVFIGSQAPTPVVEKDWIKVAFSSRDIYNRSWCFHYKLDKKNLLNILEKSNLHSSLLHAPTGKPGWYYSDGFMISQFFQDNQKRDYIYFTGWEKGNNKEVKYRTSCGLVYNEEVFQAPIIDRTHLAPCGSSMPFRYGNEIYYMAFDKWENGEPYYSIASWYKNDQGYLLNKPIVERLEHEGGLARPVRFDLNIDGWANHIMFSARGKTQYRTNPKEFYKLYLSTYKSNKEDQWYWERSIKPLEIEGEDSEFLAYGYPFKLDEQFYLLYNIGFTGPINIAIMEI